MLSAKQWWRHSVASVNWQCNWFGVLLQFTILVDSNWAELIWIDDSVDLNWVGWYSCNCMEYGQVLKWPDGRFGLADHMQYYEWINKSIFWNNEPWLWMYYASVKMSQCTRDILEVSQDDLERANKAIAEVTECSSYERNHTGWKWMVEARGIAARDGWQYLDPIKGWMTNRDTLQLRWMTRHGSCLEMDGGQIWIAIRYDWITGGGQPKVNHRTWISGVGLQKTNDNLSPCHLWRYGGNEKLHCTGIHFLWLPATKLQSITNRQIHTVLPTVYYQRHQAWVTMPHTALTWPQCSRVTQLHDISKQYDISYQQSNNLYAGGQQCHNGNNPDLGELWYQKCRILLC